MSELVLVKRDDIAVPAIALAPLTLVDGLTQRDTERWHRFLRRVDQAGAGELFDVETVLKRSGPFHRRHMALEADVFNCQERIQDFDSFRAWLKIGAGFVDWMAGPTGGVVPVPRSISYAKADEDVFSEFHAKAVTFLRGPHAAGYLWPHLKGPRADAMMDSILRGFDE